MRNKINNVKKSIANQNGSIELHDLLTAEVRRFLALTAEDGFSVSGSFSAEELADRLARYEAAVSDLALMLACVSHWGQPINASAFRKSLARSADRLESEGGNTIWLALRRYPILLEFYSAGISSVNAGRYDWLTLLFETSMEIADGGKHNLSLVSLAADTFLKFNRADVFKKLPGNERLKTPISEHLYKILQPGLDDCLFLGKSYENDFDKFEILFSLAACDASRQADEGTWGPLGRFLWKGRHGRSPFRELTDEAARLKQSWPPIQSGMFGGDYARFESASDFIGDMVSRNMF